MLKDLRHRFGAVRDQGARATCLALSLSDAHAAVRSINWESLSGEYLFYSAKQRDPTPVEHGTTVAACCDALRLDGQPAERDWPYMQVIDPLSWRPPPGITTLCRRDSASGIAAFDAVLQAVDADTPLVLCLRLSEAFFMPDAAAVVDATEPGSVVYRHAVVAVGSGRCDGNRLLLVRNSWGVAWGREGHAWLTETYVNHRIEGVIALS